MTGKEGGRRKGGEERGGRKKRKKKKGREEEMEGGIEGKGEGRKQAGRKDQVGIF